MKEMMMTLALAAIGTASLFQACKKDEEPNNTNNTTTGADLPDVYKKYYNVEKIYVDGDYIVIESKDLPDHKSPYYDRSSDKYEAYNGSNTNFSPNPHKIAEQTLKFRIPKNPAEAATKKTTPMGPIGIAINGVPFFNQYAGGGAPLTNEMDGFDQYNGHPQISDQYHYHMEPSWLTQTKGQDALMGFLLDGFPVYGPMENGKAVTNADLDAYHGHKHATADYPDGIYHYHVTSQDPYLNGGGFFGTAGTVTE